MLSMFEDLFMGKKGRERECGVRKWTREREYIREHKDIELNKQ